MKARLRRILNSYFDYYHRSRTHLSLRKDSPEPRAIQPPEMGLSWRCRRSADCTTATNDGLPERVRINPARIGFPPSDFLVPRMPRAQVRITANLVHQIQAGSASSSTLSGSSGRITATLGLLRIFGRHSCEEVLWVVLPTERARIELPYHVAAIRFRNRHSL